MRSGQPDDEFGGVLVLRLPRSFLPQRVLRAASAPGPLPRPTCDERRSPRGLCALGARTISNDDILSSRGLPPPSTYHLPRVWGGNPIAVTAGGAGGTAPGALSTGPDCGPHLSLGRPLGGGRRHKNLLRRKILRSAAPRAPGFGESPPGGGVTAFGRIPSLRSVGLDTHRRRSVGGDCWVCGGIMLGCPLPWWVW